MTPIEINFLLWVLMALLAVLAFIGKLAVGKLGDIASSVGRIEKDLSVLTNDHTNLKESHDDLKKRVLRIEEKKWN